MLSKFVASAITVLGWLKNMKSRKNQICLSGDSQVWCSPANVQVLSHWKHSRCTFERIASGKLPTDWKSSVVVPFQRKVTILTHQIISPVLSKVSECHMSNLLYDHLLEHAPLSNGAFYQVHQPQMLFCLPLMTGTKLLTVVLRYVSSFLTFIWQCVPLVYYRKTETVEYQWNFYSLVDRQKAVY